MNISYKWLKKFVDVDYTPAEIDHILTMLGIEVESIMDYGSKYEGFVTAKVLEKEKHPNADKLSVCRVDDGSAVRTVVCGAPNVEAGQHVVLGLPGAKVPQSGIVLEKRAVRKIESEGMICSKSELELGEDHSGIWVLPDEAPLGEPLSNYMDINDVIFEISVTPNRADCLSHLGLARELAAYSGKELKMPDNSIQAGDRNQEIGIQVIIEDPVNCPRYTARVVKGVKIGESPEWLKNIIINLGLRPVNVAVDVTNYVLYELGQPLHAFDLGKIAGNKIIVKTANEGEKFVTLDSKERTLDDRMLMICDAEKPVAVAGVMGGENSEISSTTTDILIESAYFNASSVRRTAKKLGLSSDASYRFERGVDINNIVYALDRAAKLMAELAGGNVESLIDEYPLKKESPAINVRYRRANDIIGVDIPAEDVKKMLKSLNFEILGDEDGTVEVQPPSYRVDIAIEVDVIEEIARMYNYDNIEPDFTASIDFKSEAVPEVLSVPALKPAIRSFLIRNGYHEIITQNITDPASAALFGEEPVIIANPLGEELSVMRTSLLPSALKVVERNHRLGSLDLRLFEIGRSFHKVDDKEQTFIQGFRENEELVIVLTGKNYPVQWGQPAKDVDFYDAKGIYEDMSEFLRLDGIKLVKSKSEDKIFTRNTLDISYKGKPIGLIGSVSKDVLKKYDITKDVFVVIADLSQIYNVPVKKPYYSHVSQFPGSSRDLAFMVPAEAEAGEMMKEIRNNGGEFLKSVVVFDVYSGKSIEAGKKSIAFSLYFSSPERTLVEQEVEQAVEKIVKIVENKFEASLRKF